MVRELKWTKEALAQYETLRKAAQQASKGRVGKGASKSSRQEGTFKQVAKCIQMLAANPRHPGLATHEFSSIAHPWEKGGKVFEAYAQNRTPGAYRVFWCYGPKKNEITIISITGHP